MLGYDPKCNPGALNEFGAAAFRFGHSLIRGQLHRMDQFFNVKEPHIQLRDMFNNPDRLYEVRFFIYRYILPPCSRVFYYVKNYLFTFSFHCWTIHCCRCKWWTRSCVDSSPIPSKPWTNLLQMRSLIISLKSQIRVSLDSTSSPSIFKEVLFCLLSCIWMRVYTYILRFPWKSLTFLCARLWQHSLRLPSCFLVLHLYLG